MYSHHALRIRINTNAAVNEPFMEAGSDQTPNYKLLSNICVICSFSVMILERDILLFIVHLLWFSANYLLWLYFISAAQIARVAWHILNSIGWSS